MTRPQFPSDIDECEIVPDSELEFEDLENAAQNESLGESSDDFVPEESSQSDVPQDGESDVPLRMPKAILNTFTRPSSSKAGPSSKALRGRTSIAKAQSEADSSEPSDTDDSPISSTNAPRRGAVTTRGKGRRNHPQSRRRAVPRGRKRGRRPRSDESVDGEFDNSDGILEPSDDDAKPPPKGLQPHETLGLIKVAQRRMCKKLGRKLTLVRPSIARSRPLVLTIVLLFFSVRSRQHNFTSFTQN